jgi:predicted 3-demethylubiquinone-9 3-methyltransferase (glyoxalase superfamily)
LNHSQPKVVAEAEWRAAHERLLGQDELDYYWQQLSEGGDEKAQQCGWLKDKYGVSWQVVPTVLIEMMQ